ncbi:MAG: peptidase [Thaumarchaeota archaeon]|nr:peptidase [Nitrososphaerota archaeon]
MRYIVILLFAALIQLGVVSLARGDVFVPEDEIVRYFDSANVYTVSGAVKNTEDYPVIPTLHITITDNGKQIIVEQTLPTVFPGKDIPFKIKIPQVTSQNVTVDDLQITFESNSGKSESNVSILYDRSMIKHSDGHLVGRIINNGNTTEYNVKIYATIHGENNTFIDSTQNFEQIEKISPGQILNFTMYPDPTLAENVHYYSCFVLGDETIVPLYAIRNGEKFNFRYDSTASFVVRGFDETGTTLSLDGVNSIKFPTYVNFEFPKLSGSEKFMVFVDEKPVKFIQSQDEEGNWHVAFDIDGSSQNHIMISGFGAPAEKPVSLIGSNGKQDYLYFVIPSVIAVGLGIFFYSKRKSKSTTN